MSKILISAVFAAIVALVISSALFKGQSKKIYVPSVEKISSDFPDVNNDPSYKAVFNTQALDPTQTITIGNGQSGAPFSGQ